MVDHIPNCKFKPNGSVGCEDQSGCNNCGWNPRIDDERKMATRDRIAREAKKRRTNKWA